MSKRTRYIYLAVLAGIGSILAVGAWHSYPGQDDDNQGGFLLVLLLFTVLLLIYVPLAVNAVGACFHRKGIAG